MRVGRVHLLARGFRVAGHIEPVAAPAFSVLLRGQEPGHCLADGRVGVLLVGRHKALHLLRRGRQAREIKAQSPQERSRISVRCRRHSLRGMTLRHKGIDRIPRPRRIRYLRHRRFFGFLVGPVFAPLLQIGRVRVKLRHLAFRLLLARIRRPHRDPFLEVGDYRIIELVFGWHLEVAILVMDRREEETFLWFERHHRRPRIPAEPRPLARVEEEPALHLLALGRVAFIAVFHEGRADLLLKEFDLLSRGFRHRRGRHLLGDRRSSQDCEKGTGEEKSLHVRRRTVGVKE